MSMLAALAWDPQIRGFLIVITAIAILPGSVYLLLATNVGARIGFLLAVAALTGWITVMGITWAFYGQGLKGRQPTWKVREVVTTPGGDLKAATLPALDNFPKGWDALPKDNPELADAQAAADKVITKLGRKPLIGHEGPIIKKPTEVELRYKPMFDSGEDYVVIGGFEKGGDNSLFTIGHHKFFFRHSPHYVVVQLAPKVKLPDEFGKGGAPLKKVADPTKPVTSVIELRDQGSLRFPPVMIALSSFLIFAITCHALHRRDKQLMAARALPAPVTA